MPTLTRPIHPRDALCANELLMLLNFELSAYDECSDCHFTGVKQALRDQSGSNWRGAQLESPGEISEAARSIAHRVLDEVHDEYNLE